MPFPDHNDSEAARLLQKIDFSMTELGPAETWPELLNSTLLSCFASKIPTAIYWGRNFRLFYNDAYAPIAGIKHPASFGQPGPEVWSEIWAGLKEQFQSVLNGKKGISINDQMLMMDRFGKPEEAYFNYSLSPILDGVGDAHGVHNTAFEITEQKKAMAERQEAQRELALAVELSQVGFWKIELPSQKIVFSPRGQIAFGFQGRQDLTMSDALDALHPEDRARIVDAVNACIYEKRPYRADYRVIWPSGEIRWVEARGATRYNAQGLPIEFSGSLLDITERMEVNIALQTARDEAVRANELKSSFLANMSHEIRTPLGAMIGFADLLGDPGASLAEKANYIDILQKNGAQLGHVINDILDLSKVETGHVNFEYMVVHPVKIAHEVVSLMAVVAKEKGLALSLRDNGSSPETVISDPTRVKQVLINLVNNALKFTKVGAIEISVSGYDGKNGERCCAFEVSDTGIGIAPAAIERLFKIFSQADNSMTRKFGGTGLGLALSRALARAMGGNVRLVKSEENGGSTFHFSIESREDLRATLKLQSDFNLIKAGPAPETDALAGIRVLLVEDSPDNQELIWRYLSRYGANVEIADNGFEGVSKALATEHDVVLMDLQMPVMDGYTAVGKLRSRGYRTPIIALTAHAMADVKKKCEAIGCTGHLPKPINPRDLVEAVRAAASRSAPPSALV